ncbi:MAG: hypothetical protein ABII21_01035 [bacterium]
MAKLNDKQLLQATFEEVGTVKEQITEIKGEIVGMKGQIAEMKEEMIDSREEVNGKLDKILEVVSKKFASQHKRIKKIEDHLGFSTLM